MHSSNIGAHYILHRPAQTNISSTKNKLKGFLLMFTLSLDKHKKEIYNTVKDDIFQ